MTGLASSAAAYSEHTSDVLASNIDDHFQPPFGAHNWTQMKSQNWGSTDGSGSGGYKAFLGLAAYNGGGTIILGSTSTATEFPVEAKGSPSWNLVYDIPVTIQDDWPIKEGASQQNDYGKAQYVWMYAYGP
jgi:hypothetical protein